MLFKIDDEEWTLDLRSGKGKVSKGGAGSDKPDLTLTISDDNFVKLVMGKMGPQQVECYQACFDAFTKSMLLYFGTTRLCSLERYMSSCPATCCDWIAGILAAQAQNWWQHGHGS